MKHAYLILAHEDFETLKALIRAIDDERNDIYIHIDAKSDLPSLSSKHAKLVILSERIDVRWGDYSQIEAEMNLFRTASNNGKYSYYHILSGIDMPIKDQDYIHNFFESHAGKLFIGYQQGDNTDEIRKKVQYYHLFPSYFRKTHGCLALIIRIIRGIYIRIQFLLHIKRNNNINFKKGCNWLSVTEDFVQYVIKNAKWIEDHFSHTFCSDEIFIQTICWNSKYREQIYDSSDEYHGCMRYIDWQNGGPRIFEKEDIDSLIYSDRIFARKFDSTKYGTLQELLRKITKDNDDSI